MAAKKLFKTKASVKGLIADPHTFLATLSTDERVTLFQSLQNAYTNAKPLVPDAIYDILIGLHPELNNVGAPVPDGDSRKEKLPIWMGSLDKIKSDPKQLESWKSKFAGEYVVSDKLDGVSALLDSARGLLYTRGDGEVGQNIHHLIPLINGIPKGVPAGIMVRGELIISRVDFEEIKSRGANARNLISGLVNAKKPDVDVAKRCVFMAYELRMEEGNGKQEIPPSQQFETLHKLGFRCPWNQKGTVDTLDFDSLSQVLATRRVESDFEMDGLVISHDASHPGQIGKNPTYAFAFKNLLNQETAEVIVSEVIWNTSKDGLLKPTVEFDAVRLSGVSIKRATGFNAEYIEINLVGPGAKLLITRSGDVIPYIMRVLEPASSGKPQLPNPAIVGEYIWKGKDVELTGQSDAHDLRLLELFFDTLDIKGVSKGTVAKVFNAGFDSVRSVLDMSEANIVAIPSMQNRGPLVKDVRDKAKALTCVQLMKASNAFGAGFGERKLNSIIVAIPNAGSANASITVDQLIGIEGVSNITASKFIEGHAKFKIWLQTTGLGVSSKCETGKETCEKSKKSEKPTKPSNNKSSKLVGQIIAFSGFRNAEWEKIISDNGGRVATSISSKTTLVVVKHSDKGPSGKVNAAMEKGVRVISPAEFANEFVI